MKFIPIHTPMVDEKTCDIKIKGPMSAMLSAESVTMSEDFKNVRMTGLYELQYEDKEMFTTMLHADEEPRIIPIYCLELGFSSYVVIGDLGAFSLPILIYFGEDSHTFAPAYSDFPWIKVPLNEVIVDAVKSIDSTSNRKKIIKMIDDVCNKWFETKGCGKIMIDRHAKSLDVTRLWYQQDTGKKRKIMRHYLK